MAGGNLSARSIGRVFQPCIARPLDLFCPAMTDMRIEPFFSGPGLDRADALRSDEAALRTLSTSPHARQLEWENGLPKLEADGRLAWRDGSDPQLFLGLDGAIPCFSSIEEVVVDARSAFGQMA